MWLSRTRALRRAGVGLAATVPLALAPQTTAPAPLAIEVRARALQPGEVLSVNASASVPLQSLDAVIFERQVPMWADGAGRRWQAVVGVDVEIGEGRYEIQLRGVTRDGAEVAATHPIEVSPKAFTQRHLRVDPRYSEPPPSVRPRIAEEAARLDAIFGMLSRSMTPVLPLGTPVPQPSSSPFGSRSFFNGLPRSRHNGVDFASPSGTEIRAPAKGRVVLVDDLYFTGNTVVVDHGFGVYSLFAHLERTATQEGVDVERGDLLGWVGATGRATGPHLHWSVRVQGARVDPLSLLYAAHDSTGRPR
jgi:murein DD-endopeptidase MepM/ murein hydrolase activator NlpD